MRSVEYSQQFMQDLAAHKRQMDATAWRTVAKQFIDIVALLKRRIAMPPAQNNHRLKGTTLWWCYVTPLFLILYDLPDDDHVVLRRFGTYEELFP
jgi:mRNA-degrading endonuclease YafQ of YafQ-DinJ toxin-antitoxin module